jgi:hypothetical protein
LPDIDRQGQQLVTVSLAPDQDLSCPPVHVIDAQRGDLAGTQTHP